MTVQPSDVIATLALLMSAYATWTTVRFNAKQDKLIQSQNKLNELALAKTETDAIAERKADLNANFVKIGSSNYRLRIFNKGKGIARNVHLELLEGNDSVSRDDVARKFPIERMEQHDSVDVITGFHMGSNAKQPMKLSWSDDASAANEKTIAPTW